ncbi:ferric reductase family protein ASCRUDRAFT_86963 [Ascoidea rubescens DSM 1968]|uniref:ferric-chelate reductase (NADPH) n=1 Tax=Ascoidea rubescens DSM 1968 TaxID=1344418 RepID=A0A1D2VEZ0_9ASCO|nr:hypothetical protein ASCRUDRAFT_86963 [Ascoidea rubescens DSM 1968]ODV60196.1 hypothetical protein ASCRUDRAFT_86963 [Ascoidea rubescens DSM 1968]
MKINSAIFLAFSSLIAPAIAYGETYTDEYLWYMSCFSGVTSNVLYCDAQKKAGRGYSVTTDCACNSTAAMGSMLYCLYSQMNDPVKVEDYVIENCATQKVNYTHEKLQSIYKNATRYLVDVSELKDYNVSEDYFYSPIYHDADYVRRYYQSNKVRYENSYYGWLYGIASIAYWGCVLALCSVFHWSRILFPNFVAKCTGPITRAWRATVILPATFDKNHVDSKWLFGKLDIGLIPTRFESLVILGFYAIELAFNVSHIYTIPGGSTSRATKTLEIYGLIGIRTGVTGVWIFPLVFLFAGRNNFLISLTGINQASFSAFHRWIARAFTILAFIHSWAYMAMSIINGNIKNAIKRPYWYWGMISTAFAVGMCFQAVWYFRKNYYDFFAFVHLIFGVFCLIGLWIHCWKLRSYHEWEFCAGAIWCFDRFIRIVRCCAFGFPKVNCKIIGDDTIKIIVPKPSYWKAFPGSFCYIYFFRPARWWESHPFTIVESDGDEQHIVFYIKVKEGVTLYIYNYLMKQPDHCADIRVTVEGPYGHHQPTRKYSKTLLIAGGNGIPGPYAHALDLASRTSDKQVRLYWTIREWKNLEWFYDELAKLGHYKDRCEVYIYCTRGGDMPNFGASECSSEAGSISKGSNEKGDEPVDVQQRISQIEALSYIHFEKGRPNTLKILEDEIDTAPGSVAVMTCGHPKMSDDLRSGVARMVLKNDKRIDYFEENQLW